MRLRICALAVVAGLAGGRAVAEPPQGGELLYAAEGNRLRVFQIDTLDRPPVVERILIENASQDPVAGRDINGMICFLPDESGRFVAGEDSAQPHPPAGWGVFAPDGTQLGKLTATAGAVQPEPFGCAFHPDGLLFTTEVGDPSFLHSNGQLVLWFPPYDRFPGPPGAYPETDATSDHYCKIATDIGTAGGIAIDDRGRVYVASSTGLKVLRFSPPFPTAPDAAGGCGAKDVYGSPLADRVNRETFVWFKPLRGLWTYSGLAFAHNGNLYAASVATGRIGEFDLEGNLARIILRPPELLPPFSTGTPLGLTVDSAGTLYYADLDLVRSGLSLGPGPNGKIWRIRVEPTGEALPPERIREGLAFPDGLGVRPGDRPRP